MSGAMDTLQTETGTAPPGGGVNGAIPPFERIVAEQRAAAQGAGRRVRSSADRRLREVW